MWEGGVEEEEVDGVEKMFLSAPKPELGGDAGDGIASCRYDEEEAKELMVFRSGSEGTAVLSDIFE